MRIFTENCSLEFYERERLWNHVTVTKFDPKSVFGLWI